MGCWKCEHKAEYRQQKMNDAIAMAKIKAKETGETQAVVRTSGCIYEVFPASQTTGLNVVQYISHEDGSTNTG